MGGMAVLFNPIRQCTCTETTGGSWMHSQRSLCLCSPLFISLAARILFRKEPGGGKFVRVFVQVCTLCAASTAGGVLHFARLAMDFPVTASSYAVSASSRILISSSPPRLRSISQT